MNGDQTPEFAIGAVSKDGDHVALLVRSRPTVYIESAGKTFAQSVIDPKVTGNPWFVTWEIFSIHHVGNIVLSMESQQLDSYFFLHCNRISSTCRR